MKDEFDFYVSRFNHDPTVRGFKTLAAAFAKYIAGRLPHDRFMVKWWQASDEARTEFKKFMEAFDKLTEEIFK